MKQIVKIFIPTFGSFRNVAKEAKNTSISSERFIDFIKVIGFLKYLEMILEKLKIPVRF